MKPNFRALVSLVVGLVVAIVFTGSARGDATGGAANSQIFLPVAIGTGQGVSIPETTKVLTSDTLDHLSDVSADGKVFTFDQQTADLANLDVNDIMVGDVSAAAPSGFLRKITAVQTSGNTVTVTTAPAALDEAIEEGSIAISKTFSTADLVSMTLVDGVTLLGPADLRSADGFHFSVDDVVLYDKDGNANTIGDQITGSGEFEITPGFDFDWKVKQWELQKLEFATTVEEVSELEVSAKLAVASLDAEIKIGELNLGTITVLVGYVPVVFIVQMPIYITLEGDVSVGIRLADVRQQASLTSGVRYETNDWDVFGDFDNDFTFGPPQPTVDLSFSAGVKPPLFLLLYGVAGPYAAASPYMELDWTYLVIEQRADWELYGGLKAIVGVNIEVFSHKLANFEDTPYDYRILLASSNDPPNAPTNPAPPDLATGQPLALQLGWQGNGDPEGDPVEFSVYLEDKPGTPGVKVCDDSPNTTCNVSGLLPSTTYYWQVVAEDDKNDATKGPVWQFTTAGGGTNAPPFKPTAPSPAHNAANQVINTALQWTGGDPDGDNVTYDVLLNSGTSAPTTVVCNDLVALLCSPPGLAWNSTYSWQVVARDEHGQTTAGDVWRFSTKSAAGGQATMDIALILDSSGSMQSNDPQRLRISAAKVFADTMLNGDQAAVVGFDTASYVAFPLQKLGPDRAPVRAAIESIGESGGSTNIVAGLNTAFNELSGSAEPGPKAAVLLTDGEHNQGDWDEGSYTQYATEGWPVFTVGLGSGINETALRDIASATGGQYYALTDPNQLVQLYFTIQAAVSGSNVTTQDTFTLQQGQSRSTPTAIDPQQNSATFMVTWPGSEVVTTLVDPNGRVIDANTPGSDPLVYHAKGETYEVYRVDFPVAGGWTVETFGADLAPGGEEVVVQVAQRDDELPTSSWKEVGAGSASGGGISNTAAESSWPAVAAAPDGSVYAVWSEVIGQQAEIYVLKWNGSSWASVGGGSASGGGISSTAGLSERPTIDIAADGTVYVAWQEVYQGYYEIYVRRWDGSAWQEVGAGSASAGGISQTSTDSINAEIGVAPNNMVYVTWGEREAGDDEVYVLRWDGTVWEAMDDSAASGGISNNAANSGLPALAITSESVPYVAWNDASDGDSEIYVRRLDGSSWAEVSPGSATGGGLSNNAGASRTPAVAVNSLDLVIVTWGDDSGGVFDVYARRWTGAVWEEIGVGSASGGGISQTPGDIFGSRVAVGPNDVPYVTWFDNSSGSLEIYVRRWNGAIWEEAGTGAATGGGISSSQGASAHANIVVAPNNVPYVVWNDNSSGNHEIYIKRLTASATAYR